MERVSTLLKKLQQQLNENASARTMLNTVQILQAELMSKLDKKTVFENAKISVTMPQFFSISTETIKQGNTPENVGSEEKIIEILQVDEKEIEEELEQIKRNAKSVNAMSSQGRPSFIYDPIEEIPTLSHQAPIPEKQTSKNETSSGYPESLNERLKQEKVELSQTLTTTPIKDLKKAIGVNDRFLFINELFRGDEAMYERSIKTIQNFSIFPEAEYWIRRELKVKIGWIDSDPVVIQFDQLVKRRFS